MVKVRMTCTHLRWVTSGRDMSHANLGDKARRRMHSWAGHSRRVTDFSVLSKVSVMARSYCVKDSARLHDTLIPVFGKDN